jgi:hypothetical protein
MQAYGDLSGVVFNRRTGNLVGGTQRSKKFDKTAEVIVTKRFAKPTKVGTVALGYIKFKGERFSYREVSWDKHKEMAASIAANNNAGDWDMPELNLQLHELSSFDVDYDLELTMLDDDLLENYKTTTVGEHERNLPGQKKDGAEEKMASIFEVIVVCKSEKDQRKAFEKLSEEGYECRVLSM